MEAYERIKILRKDILKLSQADFAKPINISRSNFGNIETGKIKLTDRVLNDICRSFQVNPSWIKDGTEPMFNNKSALPDPLDIEILESFYSLSNENKKYLYGYIQRLLNEQR